MIEIKNLTKRYGSLAAVQDLSLTVAAGQVLGFLGPNGAGKSTTMKMIAGFLAPTSGTIRVCGHDVEADPLAAKRAIGYLPEGAPSYGEMTVGQFLEFIADVRQLAGEQRRNRIAEMTERLHLAKVWDQTIETLSKGYRRRVGLAQALLHDPAVLILDEPTDGLDPNQKHEVRDLISDIARDKTVVISTHILEEVAAVCDRATIIAQGRLLADATPAELEEKSTYHNAVRLRTESLDEAIEAVSKVPDVLRVEVEREASRIIAVPRPGKAPFATISDLVHKQGWAVSELSVERGRLDEVFRQITLGTKQQGVTI